MKKFALIGASGFIAPRHMRAIKDTGNTLAVAFDPYDGVGIIDSFFPEADFFVEFERFDRHVDKLRRKGGKIDYVSICSPNYLHDAHIRFALRNGSAAICEKPLVLNPRNIDGLEAVEKETGLKVNTILQLRHHQAVIDLKQQVEGLPTDRRVDVDLAYITSRGHWYDISWKGDISKSGGVATNIGIHFFDMLTWVFGKVQQNVVHVLEPRRAAGYLELERARVRWFLSINSKDLPENARQAGKTTFRSLTMNGQEVEFSDGFTELHTVSYKEILAGRGYGLRDAYTAVDIAATIRNTQPVGLRGEYHHFLKGDGR
jgi:UDP-N-acetyl-2-amino-2-deoxyglucuronate dehydrogenase